MHMGSSLLILFTLGCGGGCGGATASTVSATGAPTNGGGPTANTVDAPSGALVLNAGTAKRESYSFEEGGAKEVLTFEKERVRVSASCLVNNMLACDAMTALRKGKHVKLAANAPASVSPGTIACKQMGMKNRTGRDSSGNEDGFCLFPDGSMTSTGSLEFYVIE
jgi:putative hemolysin